MTRGFIKYIFASRVINWAEKEGEWLRNIEKWTKVSKIIDTV
jgi:hypothetical protein